VRDRIERALGRALGAEIQHGFVSLQRRLRDAFVMAPTSSALVIVVRPSIPMLEARLIRSGLL
jgi:hypothetical protein